MSVVRQLVSEALTTRRAASLLASAPKPSIAALKTAGNSLYAGKRFGAAVVAYTRAICDTHGAPDGSDHVIRAECYANRAAALFSLSCATAAARAAAPAWLRAAASDCGRALASGYPHDSAYKLLHRRARCYAALQQWGHADADFDAASRCCPPEALAAISRDRQQALRAKNEASAEAQLLAVPAACKETPPECVVALACLVTSDRGRCLVARQPIERGQTVLLEQPFALLPLNAAAECAGLESLVCDRCMSESPALIPCEALCGGARYCSEHCRDASAPLHGPWCNSGGSKLGQLLPQVQLAALMLLTELSSRIGIEAGARSIIPTQQLLDSLALASTRGEHDSPLLIDDAFEGLSDGMENASRRRAALVALLESHESAESMDASLLAALVRDSVSAAEILSSSHKDEHLHEQAMQLVLRACRASVNSFSVIRTVQPSESLQVQHASFGSGIYPVASLLNHSCAPNAIVRPFVHDATLCVTATERIECGHEVTISYGPLAARTRDRATRRSELLRRYHFTCCCCACDDNQQRQHHATTSEYRCQQCGVAIESQQHDACGACRHAVPWSELREQHRLALQLVSKATHITDKLELLAESEVPRALERTIELSSQALERLTAILVPLHRDIGVAHDALARSYAMQRHSWDAAVLHCRRALECAAHSFGEHSSEVGHEYLKLAHVLLAAQADVATRSTIERGVLHRRVSEAAVALDMAERLLLPSSATDAVAREIQLLRRQVSRSEPRT